MSNVIELNIAEIDTVVGGAGTSQAATFQQTSPLLARPTGTLAALPNKTVFASSFSSFQAQLEARR
jgi:hypothetical protein